MDIYSHKNKSLSFLSVVGSIATFSLMMLVSYSFSGASPTLMHTVAEIFAFETESSSLTTITTRNDTMSPVVIAPNPKAETLAEAESSFLLYEPETLSSDIFSRGSCPSSDDHTKHFLSPVNKKDPIGNYAPANLVEISDVVRTKNNRGICLQMTTAIRLQRMFDAAAESGHRLLVTSGYRTPDVQLGLYTNAIERAGFDGSLRVATAYHSEHQLATTVDVSGMSIQSASAAGIFENSPEYAWMRQHAHKFGFIQSYERGKEDITGYMAEAWHWRDVGEVNAELIKNSKLTLHEVLTAEDTEIVILPHANDSFTERATPSEEIAG